MPQVRPARKLKAGTAVFIRIEIRADVNDKRIRYTPANNPQLQLWKPDGTNSLDWTNMTYENETGIFSYTHQTSSSDLLGIWQVRFRVTGTTITNQSPFMDLMELV